MYKMGDTYLGRAMYALIRGSSIIKVLLPNCFTSINCSLSEPKGITSIVLLYASAHLGAYYRIDINFWYSGVYHMKQREHVVFFRNACTMQIVCMISILTVLTQRGRLQP